MKPSYLIQRLNKPTGSFRGFGMGDQLSQIPDEVKSKVYEIFSFDYMGSSEFEFYEATKSLVVIVKNRVNYSISMKEYMNRKIYYVSPCNVEEYHNCIVEIDINERGCLEPLYIERSISNNCIFQSKGWWDLKSHVLFFLEEENAQKCIDFLNMFPKPKPPKLPRRRPSTGKAKVTVDGKRLSRKEKKAMKKRKTV